MTFCLDAAGRLLHVGRWNTFDSVFPMNISELDVLPEEDPEDEPPDDVPPEDEPPDDVPDPSLTDPPPGR